MRPSQAFKFKIGKRRVRQLKDTKHQGRRVRPTSAEITIHTEMGNLRINVELAWIGKMEKPPHGTVRYGGAISIIDQIFKFGNF